MNRGICLRIALLLALAIPTLQPLVSAQNSSNGCVDKMDWLDTPAGRRAEGFFHAHNTEGDDALRGVVARTDLAACLRIGSVAAPPCFSLV